MGILSKAVSLQGMRQRDVRPWHLDVFGHSEMAACWVPQHWFTCCFPAAEPGGSVTPDELYGNDAKQFCCGASFEIIQNLANVLLE